MGEQQQETPDRSQRRRRKPLESLQKQRERREEKRTEDVKPEDVLQGEKPELLLDRFRIPSGE